MTLARRQRQISLRTESLAPDAVVCLRSPHSTRRSCIGASSLSQLALDLAERDCRELRRRLRRQPVLKDRLGVPLGGEVLDDPGRLNAVKLERGTERPFLAQRPETFSGANMIGEFATEVVFKMAARQPGKEVSGENAKVPYGGELSNRPPHVLRVGAEQPRQLPASERGEAFGRGTLRDLAKVGPPSSARHVPINALDRRRYDVDQTGIAGRVQVEALQRVSEVGRAGRARQPEAADQRFFSSLARSGRLLRAALALAVAN